MMNKSTLTILVVSVLLVLVGALWVVKKFFFDFFKYYVVSLVIFVIGTGLYLYRVQTLGFQGSFEPEKGKHAYSTRSGRYLGVVESEGHDQQRGEVWIVRPPGGYPVIYSKSRVTLKDRRALEKEPPEEPSPK
jgi:hypothetical protein